MEKNLALETELDGLVATLQHSKSWTIFR